MPRIYITYRPNDTSEDEVQYIIAQMSAAFGAENIRVTDANAQADVLKLYDFVQSYDAILLVIGRHWLEMSNEQDERLIEDPFDYLYTETFAALEKPDMWISILLVDGAKMPDEVQMPDTIRAIVRRDVIDLQSRQRFAQQLEDLRRRLGMIDSYVPEAKTEISQSPASRVRPVQPVPQPVPPAQANPTNFLPLFIFIGLILLLFYVFIAISQPDPSERFAPQLTRFAGLTERAIGVEATRADLYVAATERACPTPVPQSETPQLIATPIITDDSYTITDFSVNNPPKIFDWVSTLEIDSNGEAQVLFDPQVNSRLIVTRGAWVVLYSLQESRWQIMKQWRVDGYIENIRFSPNGYLVASTFRGRVAVLSDDGSVEQTAYPVRNRFYEIAFLSNLVMAIPEDSEPVFWTLSPLDRIQFAFDVPSGNVQSVDSSPNGDMLLLGYESGDFYLNNTLLEQEVNSGNQTTDVDFSPDGLYAGGIIRSQVYIWETATQQRVWTIDLSPFRPIHLDLLDRNTVMVNTRDDIFILYLDSREIDRIYSLSLDIVANTTYEAIFSPRKTWLAISTRDKIVLLRQCR